MNHSLAALTHISVIELDFHHDSVDGFLKIFDNTPYLINVFTTAKNITLLKDVQYAGNIVFHAYTGGLKYSFLRRHAKLISASQVVFINTIANDFGAFLALPKDNTIVLRVHNAHKQFRPFTHLFFPKSFYFLWKFVSYVARQVIGKGFLIFRPIVNRRVDYFTFPDNSITRYVKEHRYVKEQKILPSIPLKIFIEADTAYAVYKEVLNVTIIGATDLRRRQYAETIAALGSIFSREDAPAMHLTLLGKSTNAYGKEVVAQLQAIRHTRFTMSTYDKMVPETEFVERIKQTHLIISPITSEASTDIFKEVYGKTKTTGSILDFLKFGKVTLVPGHYTPPEELADYIIKYNNAKDLEKTLLDLCSGGKINVLNERSLSHVREYYSKEVVLKKTITIFEGVAHE